MALHDLILASASPRRRELLSLTGLSFIIDAPQVDERVTSGAKEAVVELAIRKARAAASGHKNCIILAADTLVAIDNQPLGKPADTTDAKVMLQSLRNRTHQVYTGVAVISAGGDLFSGVDESNVTFGPLTDEEIDCYIATGEPMDKAGAYALQGIAGLWITNVEGTPSGVIGLPLPLTRSLLAKAGITCLDNKNDPV